MSLKTGKHEIYDCFARFENWVETLMDNNFHVRCQNVSVQLPSYKKLQHISKSNMVNSNYIALFKYSKGVHSANMGFEYVIHKKLKYCIVHSTTTV